MKAPRVAQNLTKPIRQAQLYDCLINLLAPSSVTATRQIQHAKVDESDPQEHKLFDADVLLVEDNKVNQALGKNFLIQMGCRVTIASNGEAALKALAKSRYDRPLDGLSMPVMDGFEATEHIRQ